MNMPRKEIDDTNKPKEFDLLISDESEDLQEDEEDNFLSK